MFCMMKAVLLALGLASVMLAGCGNSSSTPASTANLAGSGATKFAAVAPILQSRCVPCHGGFGTEAGFIGSAGQAASLVSSKAMPQPGSAQAAAISDADRTALVNYCNGN